MEFNLKDTDNPFFYDENLYPEELSDLGLERFIFHRELARVKKVLPGARSPLWLIFPSRGGGAIEIDFFSLVFRYFLNSKSPAYFPSLFRADFLIHDAYSNLLRLIASRFTDVVWRRSFFNFLVKSMEKLKEEGILLEVLPEAEVVQEKLKAGEEALDELFFPAEEEGEELAFSLRDFSLKMIEREELGRIVRRLAEATFIWQSWEEGVKQFQSDIFLPNQAKEGLKGLFTLISSAYKPVLMFMGFERLPFLSEEQLAAVNGFLVEVETLLYRDCYFIYEVVEDKLSQVELLKRGREVELSFFPLLDLPVDSFEKAEKMVREQLAVFLPPGLNSEGLVSREVVKTAFEREKDPEKFLALLGRAWQKAAEEGKEKITAELLREVTS